jgi:hypothetical protein
MYMLMLWPPTGIEYYKTRLVVWKMEVKPVDKGCELLLKPAVRQYNDVTN